MEGWLQSTLQDEAEKSTVMTALFGSKNGPVKKWKRAYWSYKDGTLRQHHKQGGPAVTQFQVSKVTRISSKQLDVEVVKDNIVTKISLKSDKPVKPWFEALSAKKIEPRGPTALEKLDELQRDYDKLETQVAAIETLLSQEEAGVEAKNRCAQLNGDVDKLQFAGVDSVLTSELPEKLKAEAKAKRKALNAALDALRRRVAKAHEQLVDMAAHPVEEPPPADEEPPPAHSLSKEEPSEESSNGEPPRVVDLDVVDTEKTPPPPPPALAEATKS